MNEIHIGNHEKDVPQVGQIRCGGTALRTQRRAVRRFAASADVSFR